MAKTSEIIITKQLKLLDALKKSTTRLLSLANDGNIDSCLIESGNRDRIINSINEHITQIHILIKNNQLEKNDHDVVRSCIRGFNKLVKKISEIDEKIIRVLNREKENTQISIATTFELGQKFKGYNLNSVRK